MGHSSTDQESTGYGPGRLEPLLRVSDVARLLGLGRSSVYRLIWDGELTPIRIGQHPRFDPADVRALIEAHRDRPSPDDSTRIAA